MEVDVRQQRRDHRPLRGSLLRLRPFAFLDHPRVEPFSDQSQDSRVGNPLLHDFHQAFFLDVVEKGLQVHVEHPVHFLPLQPHVQRVQRLMGLTSRTKPIGIASKVFLVYLIEDRHHGLLNDFVLQRRNPQPPPPAVRRVLFGCFAGTTPLFVSSLTFMPGLCFWLPVPIRWAGWPPDGSEVSRFSRVQFSDVLMALGLRRACVELAFASPAVWPSRSEHTVGAQYGFFEARFPARRCLCLCFTRHLTAPSARLEVKMVRYSFLVGLFHPLLHAGLSRRLRSLTVTAQNRARSRWRI